MQATLDLTSVKHLTKALTCLTKYGEDLTIYAARDFLTLSTTNSSLSAYCRFKYGRQFFSRFTVQDDPTLDQKDDAVRVSGQLHVKSLLSILKHKTVEKTLERCELQITEGGAARAGGAGAVDDDEDSLESRLTVRLHCKHGVVKTHRLLLQSAAALMSPNAADAATESRLSISSRALKDMLDHFPVARGPKSDPQLVWSFAEDEVLLKGLESSLDTSVKGQLSTELSISSAEFEVYDVYAPPLTLAFHLREFLATLTYADALSVPLDMRFTEPAAPLFIEADTDLAAPLFVIATSEVHGADVPAAAGDGLQPRGRKRALESAEPASASQRAHRESAAPGSARKKPMKVVVRADSVRGASASMPPPSLPPAPSNPFAPPPSQRYAPAQSPRASMPPPATPAGRAGSVAEREPLFLPGSQLSQAASQALRESGLGEDVDLAELEAMMEDEGEEVNVVPRASQADVDMRAVGEADEEEEERDELHEEREESLELYDDEYETQFGPTQDGNTKTFRPLFDD